MIYSKSGLLLLEAIGLLKKNQQQLIPILEFRVFYQLYMLYRRNGGVYLDLRETGVLKILADYSFPEKEVVINPNDGFDLGLMMTEATVLLYTGEGIDVLENGDIKPIHARLFQKNECRLGTVEISLKTVEKMGTPKRARLHLLQEEPYPKLLISAQ